MSTAEERSRFGKPSTQGSRVHGVVQRSAVFVPGNVHADRNNAEQLATGGSAGVTVVVLNGTKIAERDPARATDLAKKSIARPAIGGRSTASGEECWVASVPANEGSFDEAVLNPGPWTTTTPKANLAARFGLPQCGAARAGDARFTAKGVPSDATVAAANRTHEDHHASDIEAVFKSTVVPWDTKLSQAKQSGRVSQAPTDCDAALFAAVGGTADQIAARLMDSYADSIAKFHATPAGRNLDVSNFASDATCDNVSVEVRPP